MRTLNIYILIVLLAFLPSLSSSVTAASLHSQKPKVIKSDIPSFKPIVATYDVYVGGLHLVTSDIFFQEENGKYHSHVIAHTYGFWQRTVPWNTMLDAEGSVLKDSFAPAEFNTRDVWENKPKVTMLHFSQKGDVTPEFDPPSHDENREIVTADQRHGALDPVTALLQMLAHVAVQKDCNVTVSVFDGKRLFDVSGSDVGQEEIDEGDYGVYKGPARLCDAGFKMVAGEWQDRKPSRFWQKNDKEAGRDPFHVWMASIDPNLPEMPVRLESGSVFGLIIIHLSRWRYATSAEIKS